MAARLLLVDDDRQILIPLAKLLGLQGYHCTTATTGTEALRILESETFDLMFLDIGLPDIDGVSLCRQIRTKHHFPIVMLTARGSTSDKMIGLEVGADDYITKPFDPPEVLARVRAHLRRTGEYATLPQEVNQIRIGSLILDLDAHDAFRNGNPVHLTAKEFDLLEVLARNCGRAVERDWLFEKVWGYDAEMGLKTLPVYMRRLRCKIETNPNSPEYLLTVRGFGYKMCYPGEN